MGALMRRSACRKRAAPKSRIHSAVTILPVKPTHSGAGASDAHHLGRPFSSTPRGRVGGAKSSADVWTLAAGLGTGGAGAGSGGRSCITGCGAASRTGALRNCNGRVRLSRRASRTQDDHRGDQHARADEDARVHPFASSRTWAASNASIARGSSALSIRTVTARAAVLSAPIKIDPLMGRSM